MVTNHESGSVIVSGMNQEGKLQDPAKPVGAGTSLEPNTSQKGEMHS